MSEPHEKGRSPLRKRPALTAQLNTGIASGSSDVTPVPGGGSQLAQVAHPSQCPSGSASATAEGGPLFNIEIPDKNPSPFLQIDKTPTRSSPYPSIDTVNWSDPDELHAEITMRLHRHKYVDAEWARLTQAAKCLTQFRKRVERDKKGRSRFRHPSCRAAHAMLTMGGYDRVDTMSCCGTYGGNENPYAKSRKGYCGRRRFCASCAWWASRVTLSKFLPSFTENRDRIHAFNLSWTFPDGDLGFRIPPGPDYDGREAVQLIHRVWDVGVEALRLTTKLLPHLVEGFILVESLTATGFLPLRINPHFHGAVCCDESQLEDFKAGLEEGIPGMPAFRELSIPGLRPSVKFEPLPTIYDFLRFISYAFAAFGLGRPGSCLDDVYAGAWDNCKSDTDRRNLNREVAHYVKTFDFACFDRRRADLGGRFWHRHHRSLRCPPTKRNRKYVRDLYRDFAAEEIEAKQCSPDE